MAAKLFPMLSCADLSRSLWFYGDLLGGVENYRFPNEGELAFIALTIGESSEIGRGGIAAEPAHGRAQRPRPVTAWSSASTSTTLTRPTFERSSITSRPSLIPPTLHGVSASHGSRIPTATS